MGNIDRYPTYKGGRVTEVVVYANYIVLCRFYRYVVNISRWSPYEGGQLDRFYCTCRSQNTIQRHAYQDAEEIAELQYTTAQPGFKECQSVIV